MTSCNSFGVLGWFLIIYAIIQFSKFFYHMFYIVFEHVVTYVHPRNFVDKYGKWAVVTGCTGGIGKAYMHELAKCNMNIILISRSIRKLTEEAKIVESKYGVRTCIIQADFTNGKVVYDDIKEKLRTFKNIGILVNNVGITYERPKEFLETEDLFTWDILNVNAASVMCMTKIIAPIMKANGKGAIINVSSLTALCHPHNLSIYAGSKALVDTFTVCLQKDLSRHGIFVQSLLPSFVATPMNTYCQKENSSLMNPSAEEYARSVVGTIGLSHRTAGYWLHNLQKYVLEHELSRKFSRWVSHILFTKFEEKSVEYMSPMTL